MTFVDTNYSLRFLLEDNQAQYLQAKELFLSAALGKQELITSIVVFFEINFVLKSTYGKNKEVLVSTLSKVLGLNIIFEDQALLRHSISLFAQSNLSLEDCYNLVLAKSQKVAVFKTFDKKLDKVAKVLLEKETLDSGEFEKIVGKKKVVKI